MNNLPHTATILTPKQLAGYRSWIADLAAEALLPGGDLNHCDPEVWPYFDFTTQIGSQVYASYSNAELLTILRQRGEVLGHCPIKQDVYCVYRHYLRQRFGSWPAALEAAGLSPPRTIPPEQLQQRLHALNNEQYKACFRLLCAAEVPHHQPTKRATKADIRLLLPCFDNQKQILNQALSWFQKQDLEHRPLSWALPALPAELAELQTQAQALGRTPLRAEVAFDPAFVLWQSYQGWGRVLWVAGLKPLNGKLLENARCQYALNQAGLNLVDPYTRRKVGPEGLALLQNLCTLTRKLGRVPFRSEIPEANFQSINKIFGSWTNALAKLGLDQHRTKNPQRQSST